MQVNIFISRPGGTEAPTLLVLPHGPNAAVPRQLQSTEWDYFATTTTGDKLLGASAAVVEAEIAAKGYAIVEPTG